MHGMKNLKFIVMIVGHALNEAKTLQIEIYKTYWKQHQIGILVYGLIYKTILRK